MRDHQQMLNTQLTKKDIILFVGAIPAGVLKQIHDYEQKNNRSFRIALLYNKKEKDVSPELLKNRNIIPIACETEPTDRITEALLPYKDQLLAVTCRSEQSIPFFKQVIPHVPYLRTPTERSLDWSTRKVLMRRRFSAYNKSITPEFSVATDAKKATLDHIETKLGFPVIVKPEGLAQSVLVGICYHREELEKVLRNTFRRVDQAYKESKGRGEPGVLVEQFIEGDLYSIDAYVSSRGRVTFCPPVYVKTGKSIGFDDFFGYQQMTPTQLSKENTEKAESIAKTAIHALGLRSITAHVELIKTEKGWKVVEVGPRVGGFRDSMYKMSFDINHTMNDILIRIPEKVRAPKKILGHSATFKFFAKKEGILTKLTGIKKVQALESFKHITINKKIGDRCTFAKNGGKSVFNISLFNENRSKLLADIRRMEQTIILETEKR
jgi:biotin carboxylase